MREKRQLVRDGQQNPQLRQQQVYLPNKYGTDAASGISAFPRHFGCISHAPGAFRSKS
jgi:hypothetical protein